jgi:hypothetical protein
MPRQKSSRVALDIRGLIDRQALFRVPGGVRRDPAVERWFAYDDLQPLRAIARHWFTLMRHCGDDVCELLHDGCPVACVGDAPFGYVNAFTGHVNVGFFQGAQLDDPAGMLLGSGKRMRHVKLKPGAAVDAEGFHSLILAAYADIKRRLVAEDTSTGE